MINTWHCDNNFSTTTPDIVTSQDCTVTGTVADSATSNSGVGYHDWLFVASVFLFIISLMLWRQIFGPFKIVDK